ncbi:MAG TPA: FtsK/SpoIIIE domain-containing protein [Ktedonobacteraceae bacterium]|nr:FtsK/SpoIIIE domain-containing protein [Ktedonobacteraceae bacterium]
MSYQLPTLITRKARFWPEIPKETVKLPRAPAVIAPSPLSLLGIIFSSLCSVFIGIMILFYGHMLPESGFLVFVVLVSLVFVVVLCVLYSVRYFALRRAAQQAQHQYQQQLQEVEKHLQMLHWQERQAQMELSPPLVLPTEVPPAYEHLTVTPLLNRSFDEQDPLLWARRPGDPDFLALRFGLGQRLASFQVQEGPREQTETLSRSLVRQFESAQELHVRYRALTVPLTIALYKRAPVAIVESYHLLARARALVQSLVAQLAYHHSPQDVRIVVLAPQAQNLTWQWMRALPHTQSFEPLYDVTTEAQQPHMVALGTHAVNEQLAALSRELGRRELLLHDLSSQAFGTVEARMQFPHLVVIVDYFEVEDEVNTIFYASQAPSSRMAAQRPSQPLVSPLQRPELARALYDGPRLGVSLVCINVQQSGIPANSSALLLLHSASTANIMLSETTPLPSIAKLDLTQSEQSKTEQAGATPQIEGTLHELRPEPAEVLVCQQLDIYPAAILHEFGRRMQRLRMLPEKRPELRMQVDLRTLFTPALDVTGNQNILHWQDPLFRAPSFTGKASPLLRIPIGMKCGDELQYLDLLKDGPHGVLIGQAGSGKNELLQTLLLAFALAYRPAEMAFLLMDQGTGQALAPFRALPHTLGYLDRDPSPAVLQRFLTMVRAEIAGRQARLHEGKAFPRLLILIDECLMLAELADVLLDELLALTLVSRDLGVHLLFVASSPFSKEIHVAGKARYYEQIRDQVQYRLCLRCASVEESQAVIYRGDAAFLPASLPGRTYFLHGDNQLDLFQAARFMQPGMQEPARLFPRHEPSTDKDIAAAFAEPIMEI